jgi:hypothetical protein
MNELLSHDDDLSQSDCSDGEFHEGIVPLTDTRYKRRWPIDGDT